ncbi:WSC-domain-containing protein [Gymnopus androsaceus JB14]|uniref:WSC-domain-containing protein n=1 Tax=Gymnopus androsaceus JB14 TaxID=1447944 RepID=A0A6A4HEM9_9AGAR|nr:WSC-domain-containing protein [Gymnopus androsaceus JB14]
MHLSFFLPVILFLTLPSLSFSKHARSKRDDTKYVFMHHIVGSESSYHRPALIVSLLKPSGNIRYVSLHVSLHSYLVLYSCSYSYDYNAWVSDFNQMLPKQIDAVALNVGGDSWQWDRILDAYNAAAATDMKVFISFDYTSFACDVGTTVNWVNHLNQQGSQFRIDGRPMISSYSGFCLGAGGWQSVRDQTGGYLMPFIYGMDSDQSLNSDSTFGFFDSWYCWGCAWPQGDYNKSTADDQYYMGILGNRYATTVSPWMYTHYDSKNFYLRGDDWLINNRWEQLIAMRDQLTFVENGDLVRMISANLITMVHSPLDCSLREPHGLLAFPHTGFFDLSAYYITAFKTGTYPQIKEDIIYFWSRPHPAAITANSDHLPRPTGWDWTLDTLWATVFCSSTCSVTLQVGTHSQDFDDLPCGVSKISLPLDDFGSVTVIMTKGNQQTTTTPTLDLQPPLFQSQHLQRQPRTTTSASASASPTAAPSSGYVGDDQMTPAKCQSFCVDYTYAGVEYGTQCYCGTELTGNGATGAIVDDSQCTSPCGGASSTMCGGIWMLSVYTVSTTPAARDASSLIGCIAEGTTGSRRALADASYSDPAMTPAMCQSKCSGYTYAGVEYSTECYCGNSLTGNGASGTVVDGSNCVSTCGGDSTQMCGGTWYLSVYTTSSTTLSSSNSTWNSQGCYVDESPRILQGYFGDQDSMTTESCISICSGLEFTMAATEYGSQCLCGNSLVGASTADSGDCSFPCAGNSVEVCGGNWRANVYIAPGVSV